MVLFLGTCVVVLWSGTIESVRGVVVPGCVFVSVDRLGLCGLCGV